MSDEDNPYVTAADVPEVMLPLVEAAGTLALKGDCGIIVDQERQYATPDTRVPEGWILDVTKCGIEGVRWDEVEWLP